MSVCAQTNSKKVFLLGFDGGTFNVIKPLLKQGELPNLAKIIREGVCAELDSTIPPLTPVAWPGMFTGKLSGKTGVFDFSLPTGKIDKKTDQPERKQVNSSFIKSKPIWELLTEKGKRSIVLDVPLTYPPSEIDGIMIARVMSTQPSKTVYPKDLYRKLKRQGLIFKKSEKQKNENLEAVHREIDKKQKQRKKLSPKEKRLVTKENFQGLLGSIDEKVRLIRYLNENYPWDFFMAVFMESDQIGHGFWRDQRKVKKVYQKLDDALGEVFSVLPEDSLKIIVSDHGFQWIRGHFFLDEWLYRKGYAKKTFEPDEEAKKLLKNLEKFKESFSKKPGRHMGKFGYQPKIDYKDSKAYLYSGTSYGIRVNLKGRDSYGVVELQDYQSLRDELIAELKKIREPGTNRKIFSKVLKKEDVIGNVAEDDAYAASDIYFLPNNMDYGIISFDKSNRLYKKINDGFHRKEGIFFALGKEFKKGFDAGKLSILDITPNILHIMGLEVPEDMDGKVRKEIFTNGSESYQRKVAFGQPSQRKAAQKRLSRREEEEIKKRLAALGYME